MSLIFFLVPIARTSPGTVPAFLPAIGACAVFGLALTTQMLAAQGIASRFLPLGYLALAFGAQTVLAAGYLVTYPGLFFSGRTFGAGGQTAVWLYIAWHWVFFAIIAIYVVVSVRAVRARDARRDERRFRLVAALTVGGVAAILVATIVGAHALPVLLDGDRYEPNLFRRIYPPTTAAANAALLTAFLLTRRLKTVVDLGVGLTLLALLCEELFALNIGGRYMTGWYGARVEWFVASLAFAMLLVNQVGSLNAGLVDDNRWLTTASFTDALTGLPNRRAFDARLHEGFERCRASGEPYALLLVDVDEFKPFNDRFGHLRGDAALTAVGTVLAHARTDRGDFAARIGGEEFVVALPGVGRARAFAIGEMLRHAIADLAIPQYEGCPTGSLTVSIGVASTEDAPTERNLALLARADLALYAAKRAGRNRTHLGALRRERDGVNG